MGTLSCLGKLVLSLSGDAVETRYQSIRLLADDDIVHPIMKVVDKCNEKVVGSIPTRGAKKLDTNSDFEDERVRSPSPAKSGAGLRFATAPPSLWTGNEADFNAFGGIENV